jgi:hypothetical protein
MCGRSVVSSTNKNDRHDIIEILFESGLKIPYYNPNPIQYHILFKVLFYHNNHLIQKILSPIAFL